VGVGCWPSVPSGPNHPSLGANASLSRRLSRRLTRLGSGLLAEFRLEIMTAQQLTCAPLDARARSPRRLLRRLEDRGNRKGCRNRGLKGEDRLHSFSPTCASYYCLLPEHIEHMLETAMRYLGGVDEMNCKTTVRWLAWCHSRDSCQSCQS
jgi:hypothetical protein